MRFRFCATHGSLAGGGSCVKPIARSSRSLKRLGQLVIVLNTRHVTGWFMSPYLSTPVSPGLTSGVIQ